MLRTVFVFGCQRSGTTALMDFLARCGPQMKVFPECNSELTDKTLPEGGVTVRLNPLEDVEAVLGRLHEKVAVLKPLVESQRAGELLGRFPGSVGLWLFRHFREVASSMIEKWGPPVGAPHLRQVIDASGEGNWRCESVPASVRILLEELYRPDMPTEDAAALFWYARNAQCFAQELDRNKRVLLLNYTHMCSVPDYLDRALDHFEIPHLPSAPHFSPESLGKGREMVLDGRTEELCAEMLAKLERHQYA